jgi:hypothetical protein
MNIFQPFLEAPESSLLRFFTSTDGSRIAVFDASARQLERLLVEMTSLSSSKTCSSMLNPVANAYKQCCPHVQRAQRLALLPLALSKLLGRGGTVISGIRGHRARISVSGKTEQWSIFSGSPEMEGQALASKPTPWSRGNCMFNHC